MNDKTRKKLTRQKRIWEYTVAKRKQTEREISNLEYEVQKIQNSQPQIVKKTSEKELARIEASKVSTESKNIIDIKEYRKKRAKKNKHGHN